MTLSVMWLLLSMQFHLSKVNNLKTKDQNLKRYIFIAFLIFAWFKSSFTAL